MPEAAAVVNHDARGFLAAVLKSEEADGGEPRGVPVICDAEYSAHINYFLSYPLT
jgi:hypothetical protein